MNAMTMRQVPDGRGGFRHVPGPATPAKRTRRTRTAPDPIKSTGDSAAEQLRLFIERIENLEEEKKEIADQIGEVKAEAKSMGYDVRTITTIVRLRSMDAASREEADGLLETYRASLNV